MKKAAKPARARGRPGVDSLPLPPKRYDPATNDDFETKQKCEAEDRERARQLRREAARNQIDRPQLLSLANTIDPDVTDYPETLASSRCMREHRRRIVGALWRFLDE